MPTEHSSPEGLSFEKSRFQYCKELYERERSRKEGLESKAQTILSLVTLVLGVFFFKLDFMDRLKQWLDSGGLPEVVVWMMTASLSILALSLSAALFSVLKSFQLQRYKEEHPKHFISALFAPDSRYLGAEGEASFYRSTAMSYAIALERNSEINDRKAVWVKYSWYGMTAAGGALAVFLLLYAFAALS
jgi:hypothetical protein